MEALGAVAQACGWPEPRCAELAGLSERLVHGIRSDALPLAHLRVRGLGRALLRRLVAAGFADASSLKAAGAEAVRKALNHKGAFAALWAELTEGEVPSTPARYPDATEQIVLKAAEPAAIYGGGEEAPAEPPDAVLVVNLHERRVTYRGQEIRTKPPNNLPRQPLLALAVLAGRPGEVMTMADLAERMFNLGGLRERPVAPDAKDIRYKLLRPFKKAMNGTAAKASSTSSSSRFQVWGCASTCRGLRSLSARPRWNRDGERTTGILRAWSRLYNLFLWRPALRLPSF